jgi:hypothetical protein
MVLKGLVVIVDFEDDFGSIEIDSQEPNIAMLVNIDRRSFLPFHR